MQTLLVIPARFASTRLPGKVLKVAHGKPILQHVWERCRRARRIDRVIVATDDRRVEEACRSFGAEVLLTSRSHPNGTSRCAEVARRFRPSRIVNVQADEPHIRPSMIDAAASLLRSFPMSTLATELPNRREFRNPNRVKVVVDHSGRALYFSRAPIPHGTLAGFKPLLHIGLYGYRAETLRRLMRLRPARLERAERLEQLRALANGIEIGVRVVPGPWPGGIDTPADLRAFRRKRNM
jgi:3-deoxy-manno-octulosonate cytidylyltransferase (CMP-KDO synthetase)